MRWTLAAVLAVSAMLATSACQDQQARNENARLQAELNSLKEKQSNNGGGNNELLAALLADRKGGDSDALEKKLNSLGEDLNAGLDDIEKAQEEAREEDKKRMDDLEERLDEVSDLEKTISSLKTMIETLESKVQSVDPNETLTHIKAKMEAEADLKVEQEARKAAEAQVEALRADLQDAQAEVASLKDDVKKLSGDDISTHPDYRKLRDELRDAKDEIEKQKTDFQNLKDDYNRLLESVGKGPLVKEGDDAKELPENYDFSGKIVSVSKGRRPDGPSILLIEDIQGSIPPIGTQLVVLDAKNDPICNIKVIRHYHYNDNDDMPVESVGAETINELPTRPVAKGDRVLWVTEEEDSGGNAGGE